MENTWRWFGKRDKITLAMLRQIGVESLPVVETIKYGGPGAVRATLHKYVVAR